MFPCVLCTPALHLCSEACTLFQTGKRLSYLRTSNIEVDGQSLLWGDTAMPLHLHEPSLALTFNMKGRVYVLDLT